MTEKFAPKLWIRNPHLQTILGCLKMRDPGRHPMIECTREMIIEGGNGVRLLGYHSPHAHEKSRGLITLIHGWEGSSDSTYVLSTGKYLYDRGYDIFRLNLRDHGDSHRLNEGLFHGALIEETFQAVQNISLLSENIPLYIIGFSLGGNFALRIAAKHSLCKIPNLRHVIAVSPALDPYKATLSIDESLSVYRFYFLNKWKSSLRKKQRLFPDKYDFQDILKMRTCMGLTKAIMSYYPDFKGYSEYFAQYTLRDNYFRNLSVPVSVIASEDDPIVFIGDIRALKESRYLRISLQAYGGHCGFIDFFPFRCWYEGEIEQILRRSEEMS
ncbi:MAG: YheT family hydrolase [Syntrophales bacterium]